MSIFDVYSEIVIRGPKRKPLRDELYRSLSEVDRQWMFENEHLIKLAHRNKPQIVLRVLSGVKRGEVFSSLALLCDSLKENKTKHVKKLQILTYVDRVALRLAVTDTFEDIQSKFNTQKREEKEEWQADIALYLNVYATTAAKFSDESTWERLAAEREKQSPRDVILALSVAKNGQYLLESHNQSVLDMSENEIQAVASYLEATGDPDIDREQSIPLDTVQWVVAALSRTWVYGRELAERFKDMISAKDFSYRDLLPSEPSREPMPHQKTEPPKKDPTPS